MFDIDPQKITALGVLAFLVCDFGLVVYFVKRASRAKEKEKALEAEAKELEGRSQGSDGQY